MPNESEDEESETFRFLKKHIKYKVSELFFGSSNICRRICRRYDNPLLYRKREGLCKHFVSVFNINGAHGFLYKGL